MAGPRPDSGSSGFDNDYQVINLSISWGMLSIVAFAVILTLQVFGRVLGVTLAQMTLVTLSLAFVGFAVGLVGLRSGRGRGAARVGAFLNGTVLLCVFVILPVAYQILRRLG